MAGARLEVDGLVAGYGATRVIEDLSFEAPAGSRLAVLGRNGMGKTTLLASLMGLTDRHAGRIALAGADISRLRSPARARAGLGYVPQTRDIFASLSVEENLLVGLKGRPRAALAEAWRMFPRLGERRRNPAATLSGGEQQMLSTARTLLGEPSVLLLDEPLEGLAPLICDELMASLVRRVTDRGITVVIVEQQIERALDFADAVIILERGSIAWPGTPGALEARHEIVERYLGVRQT